MIDNIRFSNNKYIVVGYREDGQRVSAEFKKEEFDFVQQKLEKTKTEEEIEKEEEEARRKQLENFNSMSAQMEQMTKLLQMQQQMLMTLQNKLNEKEKNEPMTEEGTTAENNA